jgi:hypothetical protein
MSSEETEVDRQNSKLVLTQATKKLNRRKQHITDGCPADENKGKQE